MRRFATTFMHTHHGTATPGKSAASGVSPGLRQLVQRRDAEAPSIAREVPSASSQLRPAAALVEPARGHDFGRIRVHADENRALDGVRGLGGGRPLDAATRSYFAPLLGHDLRAVRIHTDRQASTLARRLGAAAVTAGQDIAFREGAFAPDTTAGRRRLGHELIHTVQQIPGTRSVPATASRVSDPGDVAEREADVGSAALAEGRPFAPVVASAGVVARDVERPTTPVGKAATFTQDGTLLKVTIPFPELFQGINTQSGFRNRLVIRAVLRTAAGDQPVATAQRTAEITFDLWDEKYLVSVDGRRSSTPGRTLQEALAPCWSDIAFPAAVLASGVSYVVTGDAALNLVSGAEMHRQVGEWMGTSLFARLTMRFLDVPPDRADAWVAFRTQPFTAR
jgi:hypothetical protein